ncbi:glutamine-synthetase adenylyltransferase [Pontivivens ytuae]|uniref:Glutamine-synthetase adenylyltransferase n=1 Tax=Pontivivens ytuae TaxID=2789856 RepID=A0A7S9LQW5_9RHOB|nr:glutamine-synthetase adenylyltransferase [Pontivivens ytuae]QPH53634.1 glutamine-synthetase adenylyltransferase [Pontivivens ytuae]
MSLSDRIRRAPVPWDATRGREVAAPFAGPLADLVAGAAGNARFLGALATREAEWLASIAVAAPEDTLKALCQLSEGDPAVVLRRAKRRLALLTALCDLGGIWSTAEVTGALSRFADAALDHALASLIAVERARGKLTGAPTGFVALAMGKLGARELNYSSDIDIICLFDESLHDPADQAEIRAVLVGVTKKLVRMMGDVTEEGYVFRTDLRLRPDPGVTPVCLSMEGAERYYETLGRTWERAAFIKARPCAGDIAAGERFLERITPFVYRRHLDFAAIRDAEDMLARIRHHKGLTGPITVPGHDVKLGRGGIREIEFHAQTKQLITGGRDPKLRQRGTIAALTALAEAGWVEDDTARQLTDDYYALRDVEHRIQMLDDAQTHLVPTGEEDRARLAALCGEPDAKIWQAGFQARLTRVHALTAPDEPHEDGGGEAAAALRSDPDAQRLMGEWPRLPALRSSRAEMLFSRLEPAILSRLSDAADPMAALIQFDRFLRGLPAGVQVFSLFDENRALLDLLVEICATAPALAQYLGRNSAVFDAVLDRDFFAPLPDCETLRAELEAAVEDAEDYERALDAARRWQKERHFRIGVHLLRGLSATAEAERAWSDLAEACLAVLLPLAIEEQAHRHGPPPGEGAMVLALGKLGAREMTAASDLDLIVIYDADLAEESAGRLPLGAPQYYARLTKRLVAALSSPMAEGTLYEVDMRLRPSGRQGPVAVSLASFDRYQREEAWVWEHLALTRARPVAGPADLRARVAGIAADVLTTPQDVEKVLRETADMRRRLFEAREAEPGPWEVKQGRGRLLDLDLFLQAGVLLTPLGDAPLGHDAVERLHEAGWLNAGERDVLAEARTLMGCVQALGRVAVNGPFRPETDGPGLAQVLLRQTGTTSIPVLEERLIAAAHAAGDLIDRRLAA